MKRSPNLTTTFKLQLFQLPNAIGITHSTAMSTGIIYSERFHTKKLIVIRKCTYTSNKCRCPNPSSYCSFRCSNSSNQLFSCKYHSRYPPCTHHFKYQFLCSSLHLSPHNICSLWTYAPFHEG